MSINTNLKSFNRLTAPKDASKLETAGDSETQSDKWDTHENLLGISMLYSSLVVMGLACIP